MSPAALALVLTLAFIGIAVVLNHCHARLALVELTLNEGLPPGHQIEVRSETSRPVDAAAVLGEGVHVFLSRNCHACQRLIDEIDQTDFRLEVAMHLRYIDRPRPIANDAAERAGAVLHSHQAELAAQAGADPLPYTVAVGTHGLVAGAVTPTVPQLVVAARDAGISIHAGTTTDPGSTA